MRWRVSRPHSAPESSTELEVHDDGITQGRKAHESPGRATALDTVRRSRAAVIHVDKRGNNNPGSSDSGSERKRGRRWQCWQAGSSGGRCW
jgi:hypothetical protein